MADRVRVDALEVTCLIGGQHDEPRTEQAVWVDLWVELDLHHPASAEALDPTQTSHLIADQADFILRAGQFWCLERACHVLLRWLLVPPSVGESRPIASAAGVSLTMVGGPPGTVSPPASMSARATDQAYTRETNPWGTVEVVAETDHLGLYRLDIAPGAGIPHHVHRRMQESEMVLTDGLIGWSTGRAPSALPAGTRRDWPLDLPHGYHNPLGHVASILCLDRPRFDPSDEVEVPGAPFLPEARP